MRIKSHKKDFAIGFCPVCGTSWCGQRFMFIYITVLRKLKEPYTHEELEHYIQKRHGFKNQSRLIFDETNGDFKCPDCKTHFQLK